MGLNQRRYEFYLSGKPAHEVCTDDTLEDMRNTMHTTLRVNGNGVILTLSSYHMYILIIALVDTSPN